jgi:hypothetical protein
LLGSANQSSKDGKMLSGRVNTGTWKGSPWSLGS